MMLPVGKANMINVENEIKDTKFNFSCLFSLIQQEKSRSQFFH